MAAFVASRGLLDNGRHAAPEEDWKGKQAREGPYAGEPCNKGWVEFTACSNWLGTDELDEFRCYKQGLKQL